MKAIDEWTPISRIELKRADAVEWVNSEPRLSGSPLMMALGANAEQVLRESSPVRYPAKGALFLQGQPGHSLFFLLRGEVRLVSQPEGDGDTFVIGTAQAGDFVGEAQVLDVGEARAFSALTDNPVEVIEFSKASLTSPQGQLAAPLQALLQAAKARRHATLNEMNSFLNRW